MDKKVILSNTRIVRSEPFFRALRNARPGTMFKFDHCFCLLDEPLDLPELSAKGVALKMWDCVVISTASPAVRTGGNGHDIQFCYFIGPGSRQQDRA